MLANELSKNRRKVSEIKIGFEKDFENENWKTSMPNLSSRSNRKII